MYAGRGEAEDKTPVALDSIDRRILAVLSVDGRISMRALAEKVHLSRSQAYARFERLIRSGVIERFSAVVRPERLGLGSSALIALTIRQEESDSVERRLSTLPYVHSLYALAGAFELLVLVRTPDQAEMRDTVMQELGRIPGVLSTKTWMIFSEVHHSRLAHEEET